jgi:hypothetical protein
MHSTKQAHQNLCLGSRHCRRTVQACASGHNAGNYKAVISYDGTNYRGYQLQAGKHAAPTIQRELERCLLQILQTDRERLNLQGAGRTDAGVHARGQVLRCGKDPSMMETIMLHSSLFRPQRSAGGELPGQEGRRPRAAAAFAEPDAAG